MSTAASPQAIARALLPVRTWWRTLPARERWLLGLGGLVVGLYLLWLLALQPAIATVRSAPATLDALDLQLQTMQQLSAEAGELRATPPVNADQAAAALRAATERLGERGRLSLQADRAVLTLDNAGTEPLRAWLAEARSGARARPLEATLTRGPQGTSGTLVLAIGGRALSAVRLRWAAAGAVLGALLALLVFAPASWLAGSLARATDDRLLLAEARGSLWRGSAVLVLTGGAGSRDASALPGRLQWALGLDGAALAVRASHACCINGEVTLRLAPGLGRLRVELPATPAAARADGAAPAGIAPASGASGAAAVIGQWPASWLAGLGTPWNTLQPSGAVQLSSPGLALEQVQGRWRFSGRADVALNGIGSRLSTLDVLGNYRVTLVGSPLVSSGSRVTADTAADTAAGSQVDSTTLQLATQSGPLLLRGAGGWTGGKFRFNGQASAAAGSEAVLANLLNIIGRRQGAVSVISIG